MAEVLDPPLKFAGGKRWLLPVLRELYAPHRGRRLVEPFFGGGAVSLGLCPSRALVADVNPHLVNFYTRLKRSARPFALEMKNDSEHFYWARERFNALLDTPGGFETDEAAELFYYLNHSCFNGLLRFNNSGKFNVPFGKYKTINYRADFSEYCKTLRAWEIRCCDFTEIELLPDDLAYFDPPYDGTFDDYSAGGFSWEEQVLLCEIGASHTGPVVASNQATQRIIDLYVRSGYDVVLLEAPRSIAASGNRAPALEILAARNVDLSTAIKNAGVVTKTVDKLIAEGVNLDPTTQVAHHARTENAVAVAADVASESEIAVESEGAAVQHSLLDSDDHDRQGDGDMGYLPEGYAEEIAKSETWQRSDRARDGEYVFMHLGCKYEKTQKGPALIMEHLVVEAKRIKEDVEPNAVGTKVAYFMPDYGDAAVMLKPNTKGYICGLVGRDPKKVDNTDPDFVRTIKDVTGPTQIARGMYIRGVTFHTEKKKDGEDFIGFNWSAVPNENHPQAPSVVERRKKLDAEDARAATSAPANGAAAQSAPQVPAIPSVSSQAPPAVPQKPWVLDGWQPHPQAAGYFWRGTEAKTETELAQLYPAGR